MAVSSEGMQDHVGAKSANWLAVLSTSFPISRTQTRQNPGTRLRLSLKDGSCNRSRFRSVTVVLCGFFYHFQDKNKVWWHFILEDVFSTLRLGQVHHEWMCWTLGLKRLIPESSGKYFQQNESLQLSQHQCCLQKTRITEIERRWWKTQIYQLFIWTE